MGIKVRSITRAFKRGHMINSFGEYLSIKPFNNRANTSKRKNIHSRTTSFLTKQFLESIK